MKKIWLIIGLVFLSATLEGALSADVKNKLKSDFKALRVLVQKMLKEVYRLEKKYTLPATLDIDAIPQWPKPLKPTAQAMENKAKAIATTIRNFPLEDGKEAARFLYALLQTSRSEATEYALTAYGRIVNALLTISPGNPVAYYMVTLQYAKAEE
jgi:hypothetical protein